MITNYYNKHSGGIEKLVIHNFLISMFFIFMQFCLVLFSSHRQVSTAVLVAETLECLLWKIHCLSLLYNEIFLTKKSLSVFLDD